MVSSQSLPPASSYACPHHSRCSPKSPPCIAALLCGSPVRFVGHCPARLVGRQWAELLEVAVLFALLSQVVRVRTAGETRAHGVVLELFAVDAPGSTALAPRLVLERHATNIRS